jgi:membrane-bound metal-dependent hydrolase YbcI (DUF457 family)
MDPVSHVVFGAAINRGLLRLAPRRGTGLAIALGALSPDIDLALLATGWDRYLVAHQAGTHSLAGAIVCGSLAAVVASVLRRAETRALLLPGVAAALSHVAADLLSGGTIRPLWPIVDVPISNAGAVAFADPYSAGLLAAGGLAMWGWRSRRPQVATVVLAALAVLVAGKLVSRERAMNAARTEASAAPARLVEPEWGSLTAWRIIESDPSRVRSVAADASGAARVDTEVARFSGDHAAIDASRAAEPVSNLLRSHAFTFAVGERAPDGQAQVVWSDLRYCPPGVVSPDACAIAVIADLDASGRVLRAAVRIGEYVQPR